MTREETASMLSILRAAYPNFYSKMNAQQLNNVLDLWSEMFEHDDVSVCKLALKELIATHSGFPPDIAAVKDKIKELILAANNAPTDEELWKKLKSAISDGYYGYAEQYKKLPPVLQRYLGDAHTLRELAVTDEKTLNTVVHGQFLKQITSIREREEFSRKLSPEIKAVLSGVYKPLDGSMQLTESGVNERRNEILNQLENAGY